MSTTDRKLDTRQNYFCSLLKIWKRTTQPLIEFLCHTLDLIVEFILRVTHTSSTPSSLSLSWRQPITYRLLLWSLLTLTSNLRLVWWRLWLLSFLLGLSVVIEVIKHQVEVWIYFLSKMIFNFIFSIYWYTKSLLVLCKSPTTILLLLASSKISVDNIILVWVWIKCSGLRKIGRALRLVYQSAIHLFKIIFILKHHSRYGLLPVQTWVLTIL